MNSKIRKRAKLKKLKLRFTIQNIVLKKFPDLFYKKNFKRTRENMGINIGGRTVKGSEGEMFRVKNLRRGGIRKRERGGRECNVTVGNKDRMQYMY